MVASSVLRLQAQASNYLVCSSDQYGCPIWHVVRVRAAKEAQFMAQFNTRRKINLADYGDIVDCGYGTPPADYQK